MSETVSDYQQAAEISHNNDWLWIRPTVDNITSDLGGKLTSNIWAACNFHYATLKLRQVNLIFGMKQP